MRKAKKTSSSGDGPVGYGKPPKEHQFKKGQSGNPAGRPKVVRNLLEKESSILFQQELKRKLTATGPDGTRVTMTFLQAHYRNMCNRAMKGDKYAQKWVNDRIDREEADLMAVRKQGFELICDIKLSGERALREAQRQGRPEPTLLPDPRDINIDPYTGMWTIKGPVTSEEKNFVDSMVEFRDEQLDELKHLVGELREGIVREGAQQIVERSSMLLHKTNKALEGRYKISESEFTLLISEANRILSSKGRSPRSK